MNKKGFIDTDILLNPGFIFLFGLALSATVIGYIFSKKSELPAMPFWQLMLIIVVEFGASYFFVARG